MTFTAVATVKGAPGATTTCLLLATALAEQPARASAPPAGTGVFLVECDPSGGDLSPRLSLPSVPGLASLALASRHGLEPDMLVEHSQSLDRLPGVRLLAGVAGPDQGMALSWIYPELVGALRADDLCAVVDVGRVRSAEEPVMSVLGAARHCLLVATDSVPALLHVRACAEMVTALGVETGLVVVGDREHSSAEIARATGLEVVGSIGWDSAALAELLRPAAAHARRLTTCLERNPLLVEARRMAVHLSGASAAHPGRGAASSSRRLRHRKIILSWPIEVLARRRGRRRAALAQEPM